MRSQKITIASLILAGVILCYFLTMILLHGPQLSVPSYPMPRFIKFYSGYNILHLKGKTYGVPASEKIDWKSRSPKIAESIFIGSSENEIQQKIDAIQGKEY